MNAVSTSHRSKAYLSKKSLSFECLSGARSSVVPHHGSPLKYVEIHHEYRLIDVPKGLTRIC